MLDTSASSFILLSAFAKIVCEPGWKWQVRERPMPNYDLFYVWSGEGTVVLNGESYPVSKGSCFLFKPGDDTRATHNPQKPLILTYIHFDLTEQPEIIPASYRMLEETIEVEHMLARYVRLRLERAYGAEEECRLILKQLMIHLLRADRKEPQERPTSHQLTEVIRETDQLCAPASRASSSRRGFGGTGRAVTALFFNQIQGVAGCFRSISYHQHAN